MTGTPVASVMLAIQKRRCMPNEVAVVAIRRQRAAAVVADGGPSLISRYIKHYVGYRYVEI